MTADLTRGADLIRGADLTFTARGPARPRRSPLAHRAADFAALTGSVTLAELPYLSQVNLRVDPASAAATRVEKVLGVALPSPNTVAGTPADEQAVLWLGPDEWLVVGSPGSSAGLLGRLHEALGADPGSVVDVSANRTTLVVGGFAARDLLEKGCTLDLHARSFTAGHCAQTTFARALMILWQTEPAAEPSDPEYRLLVRASFADYVAAWLLDAAQEFTVP